MKISIIGSGAMGSLFGGHLSEKHDVYLIDVWEDHINTINQKGLITLDKEGGEKITHPTGVLNSEKLPVMDLVLIFVKSIHTKQSMAQSKNIVGENTLVLTLQNGYGNDLDLMELVDPSHVVVGTTSHGCTILEPGKIFHARSGKTITGTATDGMAGVGVIAEVLRESGFEVEIKEDIKKLVFHKLFINTGINALTALLDVPNGEIGQDPYLKDAAQLLVDEAVQITNSLGYQFNEEEIFQDVLDVSETTSENKSSMRADVLNKRETEIDKINGAFVKIAEEQGLKAPANELVRNLIRFLESKF